MKGGERRTAWAAKGVQTLEAVWDANCEPQILSSWLTTKGFSLTQWAVHIDFICGSLELAKGPEPVPSEGGLSVATRWEASIFSLLVEQEGLFFQLENSHRFYLWTLEWEKGA